MGARNAVSLATYPGYVVGLAHRQQMPCDVAQAGHRDLKARYGKSAVVYLAYRGHVCGEQYSAAVLPLVHGETAARSLN